MVREAQKEDLKEILELYLCLHEQSVPEESDYLLHTWEQMHLLKEMKTAIAGSINFRSGVVEDTHAPFI